MKCEIAKKLIGVCLSVCISLSLIACSKVQSGQETQKEPVSVSSAEETSEDETPKVETSENTVETETEKPAEPVNEPEEEPAGTVDISNYIANTEILKIKNDENTYSDLEKIPISYPLASSQLDMEYETIDKYAPDNLIDGDLATAYVEGESDDGIGQLIKLPFDNERSYEVSLIKIYPGYQKDEQTFKNNSRPVKLSFCFPDGHCFVQEFDYGNETTGYFEIDLNKVFKGKVVADYCAVSIEDTISGSKYNDCCISEIELYTPKTPDRDIVFISHESEYGEGYEKCFITAQKGGEKIWEYECSTDLVTELSGVDYITTAGGVVFVQDDWQVTALDENTGNVLWKSNCENGFSASACTYDVATGSIYLSGYYGPDIIGFDKDGKEILSDGMIGESYWPCLMVPGIEDILNGATKEIKHLRIYFEGDMSIVNYEL